MPPFSTDIAAAWQVVDAYPSLRFSLERFETKGVPLLAFVIWTKRGHPIGDMLKTQQRPSVLRDCVLPGFFTKISHREVLTPSEQGDTEDHRNSHCHVRSYTSIRACESTSDDLHVSVALAVRESRTGRDRSLLAA